MYISSSIVCETICTVKMNIPIIQLHKQQHNSCVFPRFTLPGQNDHCYSAAAGGGQAPHDEGEVVEGEWLP